MKERFLVGAWKQMKEDKCRWMVITSPFLLGVVIASTPVMAPLLIVSYIGIWVGFGFKWRGE